MTILRFYFFSLYYCILFSWDKKRLFFYLYITVFQEIHKIMKTMFNKLNKAHCLSFLYSKLLVIL